MTAVKEDSTALNTTRNANEMTTGMPPPAPPKRVARKRVLDEDAYVNALEKIIRRDYFPDLDKYKAKLELLKAIEKGDVASVQRLKASLTPSSSSRVSTPGTPRLTAISAERREGEDSTVETESGHVIDVQGVTLKDFVAKHTSEDNASFQSVLTVENEKKREKNKWLYEAEEKHKSHMAEIALPKPDETLRLEGPRASVKTWNYQTRNELMYYPRGVQLDAEQKEAFEARQLIAANTRVPEELTRAQNEAVARAKEGDTGEPKSWRDREAQSYDLDKLKATPGHAAAASPRVRGFGFLGTPSPVPGLEGESPQMTWGTIEGTPMILPAEEEAIFGDLRGAASGAGPTFHLQETRSREMVAHSLTEGVRKKRKEEQERSRQASTPLSILRRNSTPSQRLSMMSPAAQKFAKSMGVRPGTSSIIPSPAIKGRTGPSPGYKRGTPSRTSTPLSRGQTPDIKPSSITDNLLKT